MLLSALIPQGFMPSTTEEGYISVTLCTTEGMRTVLLNEQGAEVAPLRVPDLPEEQRRAAEHCLFATTLALALPELFGVSERVDSVSRPVERLTDLPVLHRIAARPIGARAPPVSA